MEISSPAASQPTKQPAKHVTTTLQVSNVCFAYPARSMFWQLNLNAGTGITWLRGNNGSGKTSLLKLLAGMLEAQSGQIFCADLEISKNPLRWRQQTFLCCSETPDFSWLSLQEFFDLHLSLYPAAQASELNRHLSAFGLLSMLNQKLAVLSLGQYKKIYLALALSLPVRLLLIDEPFNALDVHAIAYLRSELQTSQRLAHQCIIMTSHQQPDLLLSGEFELAG